MNRVASRRSRNTVVAAALIGVGLVAGACTPSETPSAPTVAPTLAKARAVPATTIPIEQRVTGT